MRIGQALQGYRFKAGVSQKTAAKEIGIAESTLCRLENGTGGLDMQAFVKLLVWLFS